MMRTDMDGRTRTGTYMCRLWALVAVAMACLALSGCIFDFRKGRQNNSNRQFESPLPALAQKNMGLPDIREQIAGRQTKMRSMRSNLMLTVGSGRMQQKIQTTMFVQFPNIMRVRGSLSAAGTVFDVLLNRNDVQVAIFPEKKYYRGTPEALAANPDILGGVYPNELITNFAVEQTLLARLSGDAQPMLYSDREHYIIRFDYQNGSSERYYLRKRDLLTDQYERYAGQQVASRIMYYGYKFWGEGDTYLLPSAFSVEAPASGGMFTADVTGVEPNVAAPEQVFTFTVPQGFHKTALSSI